MPNQQNYHSHSSNRNQNPFTMRYNPKSQDGASNRERGLTSKSVKPLVKGVNPGEQKKWFDMMFLPMLSEKKKVPWPLIRRSSKIS